MPILETRPTSPVKIAKAIAVGVAVAVPLMMFGAPLIVQYQYATLSPGDPVVHDVYNGTIESIDSSGNAVVLAIEPNGDIQRVTLPAASLRER